MNDYKDWKTTIPGGEGDATIAHSWNALKKIGGYETGTIKDKEIDSKTYRIGESKKFNRKLK